MHEGVNLGRKYCFAADFPLEVQEANKDSGIKGMDRYFTNAQIKSCSDFVKILDMLAHHATQRHQSKSLSPKFARSRLAVRALFQCLSFQLMVGVLLVFNFAMELFKAQMRDAIVASQDAPINKFLEAGDTAFLVIFTCELFMNMYAHWMKDYQMAGAALPSSLCSRAS